MKAVAYCRVSTNKNEQLDSLEAQQGFFSEYARRNGYELVHIYAEEGKSGTKMKNRGELLALLADAKLRLFDTVLIKDVSRLARNTLDFLVSIRRLRSFGIRVVFVNYDQTSSDSSEFMLTLLSAIAQEESANTSKRVKFGKEINARKGRVPNLVYGYDKRAGDYFNLQINEEEAAVVRRIYALYAVQRIGAAAIARRLNEEGVLTKRGSQWSQNAVRRILHNELYTGKVVNGKEEVKNFLTGERSRRGAEKWFVTDRPDLAVIGRELFERAASVALSREGAFFPQGRTSHKHPFSQLLICKECGFPFRRREAPKESGEAKWVCGGRSVHGAKSCQNRTAVGERWLLLEIRRFLFSFLSQRPALLKETLQAGSPALLGRDAARFKKKLETERQKYIRMYQNDIITLEELTQKTRGLAKRLQNLDGGPSPLSQRGADHAFGEEDFPLMLLTNPFLRRVFTHILVSPAGELEASVHTLADNGDRL